MKKIIIITSVSGTITFGLFAFMAFLINNDKVTITPLPPEIPVRVMKLPDETPPVVKVRPKFTPPPPSPMPRTTVPTEVNDGDPTLVYNPPTIIPAGPNKNIFTLGNNGNADARPVVRVNPKYPRTAAMDGIEGWVILSFDISAIGEVINISIIDSKPKRVFDKAAKQALRKWKYKAKSVDGKAVEQHDFSVQLDFNMGQST